MSRETNIQSLLNSTAGGSKCSASSFGRFRLYLPEKKALLAIEYSPGRFSDASEYVNCSRLVSYPVSTVVKPVVDTILTELHRLKCSSSMQYL